MVEREQFRDECGSSGAPSDERSDGSSFENGDHVLNPVRVLWVLIQDVEKTGILSGVEYAIAGVVIEHPLVPKHIDSVRRRRL